MKLEVVTLPVSDVERSKRFYAGLGWRLDADFTTGRDYRVVQVTPPESACSIHFGTGLTSAVPGSAQRLYLVVPDIVLTRAALRESGADVGEIVHRESPGEARLAGVDPQRRGYASFASFKDPDGNGWVLQEVTARLPGRMGSDALTFTSVSQLEAALVRAARAHGEHEKQLGARDANWPNWYAKYLIQEQTGQAGPAGK
jgi:catechol 2,3-dioxygenase-like lactoylglutathione lyase family enzyme